MRVHLSTSPNRVDPWSTGFLESVCTIRCDAGSHISTAIVGKSVLRTWEHPLEALDWMSKTFWPGEGRWIGYLSYDFGRLFEAIPVRVGDDLRIPLFAFTYCRKVGERSYAPEPEYGKSEFPAKSNFSRGEYLAAVGRCIEYIRAGDVFQVNLSQRFTAGLKIHPAHVYRNLVQNTPAMYGAYLGYDDFAIICNSPELFFHVTPDRQILTRPIKGTRAMNDGMAKELRESIKDQAELNMIVDLERNDLGRICKVGSIKTSPRQIDAHPTVYHGSAEIKGQLRNEIGFNQVLAAMFPGGSVTGAPKIRAIQIIDELETKRRGVYCGAIGWLDSSGEMQFNIAIRTMLARDGQIHIPVGGGIVADSDPKGEYEETLIKARAMFAAARVEIASNALKSI